MGCGTRRCENGWIWWNGSEYPCSACAEAGRRAREERERVREAARFANAEQLELAFPEPAPEVEFWEDGPDHLRGVPLGTYAFTARLMAGPNPSPEEARFWDDWKEDMKMRDW